MMFGNLCTPADTLKKREAWKYVVLEKHLQSRPHEFEFQLGKWVFDLALLDTNVLVEFDGIYHRSSQLKADAEKDAYAKEHGFLVVRRATEVCCVLDPAVLDGL
jgi:very-short-patch-repair endonuclease